MRVIVRMAVDGDPDLYAICWTGPTVACERVLSLRLKRVGVDCSEARRTALLQLAGQMPAALVSDLLGVHVATATQWA